MDLDLALRVDRPPVSTESSTLTERASYERWERSNRLSLMLIKSHISKGIRSSIPNCDKVKVFMKAIEEKFLTSDKAIANTLMKKLSSMRLNGSKGVREHIIKIRDIAAQLKTLEIEISELFLEKRLKHEKLETANLAFHGKRKGQKDKTVPQQKVQMKRYGNKGECFFCKKKGHMKKDCPKYKKWLEKKGNLFSLMSKEIHKRKKSTISSDYLVYLQESDFNVGPKADPSSFSQAMNRINSNLWYDFLTLWYQIWDLVELPKEAKAIGCKWVYKTERNSSNKFSLNQSPQNDLEKEQMKNIPYASAVGSLMYAKVCTIPDIGFVVGMLGRYQSNPGLEHWKAAKKVMRYLQGTKDYKLTYRHADSLEVIGYSNLDFAGCSDTRRSTSRYIFLLTGGVVSWRSIKQSITTSSTMQAKFVACYEATTQAL
ncbi:hypothetical protein CsSME_00029533 [Camellia sinensis var. sinensis]